MKVAEKLRKFVLKISGQEKRVGTVEIRQKFFLRFINYSEEKGSEERKNSGIFVISP
jgi:hypothetical protein